MGNTSSIGIAKETAWGTKNTSMTFYPPVSTASIKLEKEVVDVAETTGVRGASKINYGTYKVAGDIELPVRANSFGLFLAAALGAGVPTGTNPNYTHTYNPAAATALVPISIKTVNKDAFKDGLTNEWLVDLWFGCYINELEISSAVDEYLMMKASILGKDVDQTTASVAPTADTSGRFVSTVITAQLKVGGGSLTNVVLKDFNIKVNNNLKDDDKVLGSATVNSLPLGNLDVDVEFTVSGKSNIGAHYRRAMESTATDCQLVITCTNSATENVTFDLKNFNYLEAPFDINASDTVNEIKVTGRGALDGNGKVLEVVLDNSVATY